MDADFYHAGLSRILSDGHQVESVRSSLSTASGFGRRDRPWRELIGHIFAVDAVRPFLFQSPELPVHLPYCFGLLAWTLAGHQDVGTLAYYRPSAADYSDNGNTLCGAFGARLFGPDRAADQIGAIVQRLRLDPASRRSYAAITLPGDNLVETREFPCAAGIQFFRREDRLHMLTVMRAQQALTVLPYDVFLFSTLLHFIAADLGVAPGIYRHFSSTFHFYENEIPLVRKVLASPTEVIDLPPVEAGQAESLRQELIETEQHIRTAACKSDLGQLKRLAQRPLRFAFNRAARRFLMDFAQRTIRMP